MYIFLFHLIHNSKDSLIKKEREIKKHETHTRQTLRVDMLKLALQLELEEWQKEMSCLQAPNIAIHLLLQRTANSDLRTSQTPIPSGNTKVVLNHWMSVHLAYDNIIPYSVYYAP